MTKLSGLFAGLSLLLIVGVSVAIAERPGTTHAPRGAELIYAANGVPGAPPGSCAAEPLREGCPEIKGPIIVTNSLATMDECTESCADDPEDTGYAYSPSKQGGGNICFVHSSKPYLTFDPRVAHGFAKNFCEYGYGVDYTELHESIRKLNGHGYWELMDRDSKTCYGAGWCDIAAEKRCDNNNSRYWQGTALAYTVINGVPYSGSNQKYRFLDCGAS